MNLYKASEKPKKSKEDFSDNRLTLSWFSLLAEIQTESAIERPHLAEIAQMFHCHAHDTTATVRGVRKQPILLD